MIEQAKLIQAIFEDSPRGVVVADLKGEFLSSNKTAKLMFGIDLKEFTLFTRVSDAGRFLPGIAESLPPDQSPLAHAMRGESFQFDPLYLERRDGSAIWLETTGIPLRDAQGRPDGCCVTFSDIGERVRRDQILTRSEQHLREAQRIGHVGSWEWHPGMEALTWSEEAYRIAGVDPRQAADLAERQGKNAIERGFPALRAAARRTLFDGTPFSVEVEITRPDGSTAWIAAAGEEIADSPGALRGVVSDATERRRAEQARRKELDRLSTAMHAAKLNVWELNVRTGIVKADELSREVFGDLSGHDRYLKLDECLALVHPEDRDAARQALDRAIAERTPYTSDYRVIAADGDIRYMRSQAAVLADDTGASRVVGINWDTTDMRFPVEALRAEKACLAQMIEHWTEAKKAAEKANRAKAEFLAMLSHELRTPMTAMLGFSELLATQRIGTLNVKQREFVDNIVSSGHYLLKLIERILDYSQIESGQLAISIEPSDISLIMKSVTATLNQLANEKGVTLSAGNYGADMPEIEVDPVRLAQALLNLGTNAIKYNRPDGAVYFSYWVLDPDWIRITVSDTGIGIPEDRQDEVFEPFNRLGADSSTVEGRGIGLATTRGLIELMGGKIGFTSKVGQGSSFWIDLPVHHQAAPGPDPA